MRPSLVFILQMPSMLAVMFDGVRSEASTSDPINGPWHLRLVLPQRLSSTGPKEHTPLFRAAGYSKKSDIAGEIDHSLESVALAIHQLGLVPH